MKLYYTAPIGKLKIRRRFVRSKEESIWEQTILPLGNGSIGLSVYGEPEQERIILNNKYLWTGGPSPKRTDYCGGNIKADADGKSPYEYFVKVRELFKGGEISKAASLCNKLVGIEDGYGSYQCWGEINIDNLKPNGRINDYKRELDLDNAVCTVEYTTSSKGRRIKDVRKYFVSYPDNVAVLRIMREGGSIDTSIGFSSNHDAIITVNEKKIIQRGTISDNGLNYAGVLKVVSDGKVVADGDKLNISGANDIILLLALDTDYEDNYPVYRTGKSAESLVEGVIAKVDSAADKGYDTLLNNHIADYSALYDRVKLSIHDINVELPPTDKLKRIYSKKKCSQAYKRALECMVYQYGRYLTIASSRERDLLPSNLQGIWNVSDKPAWSSDFHLNVNLQMNYWPTYAANLSECAMPLIRYIDKLRTPGRLTAELYTGIASKGSEENGFLFHTQNTPFGWTCPGWDFSWGWSPAAVPWILHNVYEYYEYTCDKEMLKGTIYPMLKESCAYFTKLLIDDGCGRLVTAPCFSPEHGPRTLGNTYEQSLLMQMYLDTIHAANVLDIDSELRKEWGATVAKLKPIEIGESGQIKEWYHETQLGQIGEKKHRHMSHLLGLYPCSIINKYEHPDQIRAAVVSMNERGEKTVGWAMCQRINSWARVGDGDRALKIIGDFIAKSLNLNLWDIHPPFQIDGNFGYTAGINEMLMQSISQRIELLPALPSAWRKGKVEGLLARGNYVVDIEWEDGKLNNAHIKALKGGKCRICTPQGNLVCDKEYHAHSDCIEVELTAGESVEVKLK